MGTENPRPWEAAEEGSYWLVSGKYSDGGTFTKCVARVLPQAITGVEAPLFEVLIYGSSETVSASQIVMAAPLMFVSARNPRLALHAHDQAVLTERLAASA